MDKLQPLIKHRYWICFAFAVIFVVAGWWMASGAIAVEILARKDSVEKSFDKAKQGATEPNQTWVEAAKKENEQDSGAYKSASAQLLKRQKDARRWPDVLANDLKGIAYRADIKDSTTRGRWASIYRDEIDRLLSIVKPYKNGEGLVVVDSSKITHKPFNTWRTKYPSSTEIWDAQEDIWLLQSLLTSIARVNEGAARVTESQVRQIFKLTLRGGDRDAAPASSGGGGMMGGMDMAGGAGMMGMGMGGGAEMGGGGMGAGGGDAAKTHPGKEFEGNAGTDILTEEFGAVAGAAGGGGMGGGGMSSGGMMGGMDIGGGAGMMSGMDMGGGGGIGAAPAEERRYVDDGADLGYKTRAFVLDVIVRDDQLPNLLASLTNSDFPVEIVRVDVRSKFAPANSGGGGMPGGGGMMTGMDPSAGGMGADGGLSMPGGAAGEAGFGGDDFGGGGGDEDTLIQPGGGGYDAAGAGYGGMMPGMSPGGGGGMLDPSGKGKQALQLAMADPMLVHVKIGGLMTLYQSAQEADDQAATAETDEAVAPAPAAPGELVPDETADPNMTETPAGTDGTEPATTEIPVGEAVPPEPGTPAVAGEAAADGGDPAANPATNPEATTPGGPEAPAPGTDTPETATPGTEAPGTPAPGSDTPATGTN